MKYRVVAKFSLEGWHCWPDAPDRQSFLTKRHRHQFQIEVSAMSDDPDRGIECFDLQDAARKELQGFRAQDGTYDFGTMSCEQIAEVIMVGLSPVCMCSVLEDGIQGAVVSR